MLFKFAVTVLPLVASLAGSVVAAPLPHDGLSKARTLTLDCMGCDSTPPDTLKVKDLPTSLAASQIDQFSQTFRARNSKIVNKKASPDVSARPPATPAPSCRNYTQANGEAAKSITLDIAAIAPVNGNFTDAQEAKDAAGAAASAAFLDAGKAVKAAAGAMAAVAVDAAFGDSTSNATLSGAVESTFAKAEKAKNALGNAARAASAAFDAATAAANASSIEIDTGAASTDPALRAEAVKVLFATAQKAQDAAALAAVAAGKVLTNVCTDADPCDP
ncbi:hypothetical protein DFH09DRAFT_1079881 [Mycena vulgaris]|nr:hypothetical protein DFH09DRAFT_1079881 [Mycena vulgaris]